MTSKLNDVELCSNCCNWLEHNPGIIECDFDYFSAAPEAQAMLFVPQIFDCTDYEKIKED